MPRMLPWLVLLFPALELWVLIQVGSAIGALATVGLVIVSMFVGFAILRLRGIHIVRSMQAELASGRIPANPIIDTFCLMAAGWLFIFPGFVSDVLAVLLIIPFVRQILLALFIAQMRARGFQTQTTHFQATGDSGPDGGPVTWTCTTYSSGDPFTARPEKRGNAVVIDCEPEVIPSGTDSPGEIDVTPGDADEPR